MSSRAEIRHMHLVEGVPKKEVARRLRVNIKTVRRHVEGADEYPARKSPKRGRTLDAYRDEIEELLKKDERISAKRIGRLIEERHEIRVNARTLRRYIQDVRGAIRQPEAFVHRTHVPGETMEIDFGESWADVAGRRTKIFFFVAVLPASNAYFAKAYHFQRIECLLDGISSAIDWFGGLPNRVVFDNASMAVRKVLKGEQRIETEMFHAYRAEWPLGADFCNPASGWEKGAVERGVGFVRGLCLRPIPKVRDLDELNAQMARELDIDLDRRHLRGGQTARAALAEEVEHLRPIPAHRPETARVLSVTADKYAHVRIDRSSYSVPARFARMTLAARLYHDRVEIVHGTDVIAKHVRSKAKAEYVLELEHVLETLERKPRAAREATVIRQLGLPACFEQLRIELREAKRRSDKEWVQILGLLVDHPLAALTAAVEACLKSNAIGIGSVRQLLRGQNQARLAVDPVDLTSVEIRDIDVAPAQLALYGALLSSSLGGVHA